jgi:hypothetical protein
LSILAIPLTPVVTTEDVRLTLNGTYSGSNGNYYFWGQSISSGSVLAQINLANIWMYTALGSSIMTTTEQVTFFQVRALQLNYSCMRTLVVLSGGVISDGFNWSAGIKVDQPAMLPTYLQLISNFKDVADIYFRNLQPIGLMDDANPLELGHTAPSVM